MLLPCGWTSADAGLLSSTTLLASTSAMGSGAGGLDASLLMQNSS
jgi:hypothetical protein